MPSILDTVKATVGVSSGDGTFDVDLVIFTNSAFGELAQVGVGTDEPFMISNNTTQWSDYVTDAELQGLVESYICMSVKLVFDPPATSFVINAVQSQILELEWQINVRAEQLDPPSNPLAS